MVSCHGRFKSILHAHTLSKEILYEKINNKADSTETGCIVIAHLLPWGDQENKLLSTPLNI